MSNFKDELEMFLEHCINLYWELKDNNKSKEERDHKLEILKNLESIDYNNLDIDNLKTRLKPACRDIPVFFDLNISKNKNRDLILDFLLKNYRSFDWRHGYTELDQDIADRYAFTEIVGKDGIIKKDNISLGFVLLLKKTTYPKHIHRYVDEIYINIGNACKINGKTLNVGDIGYIPKGEVHSIESDSEFPTLLLYSWTGMENSSMEDNLKFV